MDTHLITGLILAGGSGSRMDNLDKGLQVLRGVPLVTQVMRRLQPQVGNLMISANRNLTSYESLGLAVWPDQLNGFAGPLAGLQTGLSHCTTPYLISVPCDSPFLPLDLVLRLFTSLTEQGAELAVAATGIETKQDLHPVFCLMKNTLLENLTTFLESGQRKVSVWHRSLNMVQVHFEDEAAFHNLNTLAELRRLELPDNWL
ncbi:MAG: molybdenum cofactor guanylyltransferase MobA [Herbaspirillum sp.]